MKKKTCGKNDTVKNEVFIEKIKQYDKSGNKKVLF